MRVFRYISLITAFSFLQFHSVPLWAQSKKPNIVFILADDLGYGDLGCYGSAFIKTPHLDSLANAGMRFTDFYAGSTVCAPSRASLMTGQHTGNAYIRGNGEVPLRENDTILPQWLHKAGYTNGMVGKWGLGQAGTSGAPENKGWDFFSGVLHHVEGHYQIPDSAWQIQNGQSKKIKIPGNKFSNEWFKDEAIRFINQNKDQPFFLYVSFTVPHAELIVPNIFLDSYLDTSGQSIFKPELPNKSKQHYGPQEYPKAAYAAMVSQMDKYIGEITTALNNLGIQENTLIIFTSDNGTHIEGGRRKQDVDFFRSSGAFRGVKRDLYEGGIRVPLIASQKNYILPGTVNNHPAAFWDVLPTLCEAAGLEMEPNRDGISILPAMRGKKQKQAESLYWEFYEGGFKQALRKGEWKAIRFYKGKTPIRTELYNLRSDPGETNDLSKLEPGKVAELEKIMDRKHHSTAHPLFSIQ